jgi:hypothetical protein
VDACEQGTHTFALARSDSGRSSSASTEIGLSSSSDEKYSVVFFSGVNDTLRWLFALFASARTHSHCVSAYWGVEAVRVSPYRRRKIGPESYPTNWRTCCTFATGDSPPQRRNGNPAHKPQPQPCSLTAQATLLYTHTRSCSVLCG